MGKRALYCYYFGTCVIHFNSSHGTSLLYHVDNPAMMVRDGGIIVPFVVLVKPCVLMIYVLLFTVLLMTCPKISAKLMLLFAIIGRGFIGFYNLLNTHLYAIMSNDNVSYYDYFIMEKRIESYVCDYYNRKYSLRVALGIAIGRQETRKIYFLDFGA